jgi:hypothetical protein
MHFLNTQVTLYCHIKHAEKINTYIIKDGGQFEHFDHNYNFLCNQNCINIINCNFIDANKCVSVFMVLLIGKVC